MCGIKMKNSFQKIFVKILKIKTLIIILCSLAGACIISVSLYITLNNRNEEPTAVVETQESTTEYETIETIEETTVVIEETTTAIVKEVIPVQNLNIGTNLTESQAIAIDPEKETNYSSTVNYTDLALNYDSNIKYGIDVSSHNGTINWAKVKASGVQFAIIRIGYRGYGDTGTLMYDNNFFTNIKNAYDNGLEVGVYFFSQARNETEAIEEASLVINRLNELKTNYPDVNITFPVAFDWEGYDTVSSSGYLYRVHYQKNSWTPEKLNALSTTFCDMISTAGYTPMHYGGGPSFSTWGFDNSLLSSKYKIWFSKWPKINGNVNSSLIPSNTLYPDTSFVYNMWQFTDAGIVDGISGAVDINAYYN